MQPPSKTQTKKVSAKTKTTAAQRGKTSAKNTLSLQKQTAAGPVTSEQRQQMIEEGAYFIARRQGFTEHSPMDDWLAAEVGIDKQLPEVR